MTLKLNVTLPGSGYPNISEFIVETPDNIFADLPVTEKLIGAYFLSSQNSSPLTNFADNTQNLAAVGSPVLGSQYATLNRANHYDTGLVPGVESSIVTVSLMADAVTGGMVVANFYTDQSDSLNYGSSVQVANNVFTARESGGSGPSISAAYNFGSDVPAGSMAIGTMNVTNNAVAVGFFKPTDETLAISSTVIPTRRKSDRSLLIGATYSDTVFLGDSHPSIVLIYNQSLKSADILLISKYLKNVFGARYGLF